MTSGWQNWSGSVRCPQAARVAPVDQQALCELVQQHRGPGALRPVGSGHSFVPFWADQDTLLDLQHFRGVTALDHDRVRCGAGTPLHALGPELARLGLALANMGDIDRQALAGAVATGTHGTGRALGSLSAQVTAMELVDGLGQLRRIEMPAELAAARVNLGLLGVMTTLEMRVVPLYGLHEQNWQESVDTCLEAFAERLQRYRHHEFWWVPAADLCVAKVLDRIAVPTVPQLDEIPFGEEGERWGASWQVFPSVRDLRFNEMEYAVPAEHGLECFRAVRAEMLESFPRLPWPVEYRIVAGDDGWLSPTGGGTVATLSIHQDAARDPLPLFARIEPILREFGGRPHWGKWHSLGRAELTRCYPRMHDFVRLRAEHDPEGCFLTGYLAERFGPVGGVTAGPGSQ